MLKQLRDAGRRHAEFIRK